MKYSLLNALAYEVCRLLVENKSSRKDNYIISLILNHCFADWIEWKAERTMADVDAQTANIVTQWKEEENKAVVEKFQEKYPEAKVTLHNDNGAVLIEHPPDGSKAQDLLGGTMEIKSPWSK